MTHTYPLIATPFVPDFADHNAGKARLSLDPAPSTLKCVKVKCGGASVHLNFIHESLCRYPLRHHDLNDAGTKPASFSAAEREARNKSFHQSRRSQLRVDIVTASSMTASSSECE